MPKPAASVGGPPNGRDGRCRAEPKSARRTERVGVVVPIARMGLAVLAEVGVVADSALVSDALNVRQVLLVLAQRSIAVDAVVAVAGVERLGQRLVDGHEAMTGVDELGVLDALRAEVPVGAVQALVADAVDELVAAIADSRVADIAA